MRKSRLYQIAELNFAMVLISTSGALGRYITLPPTYTILLRAVLAGLFLYLFCKWRGIDLHLNTLVKNKNIALSGLLMGAHWVTYFYSLQFSNVAIGLLSIYTHPIIASFLEPFLLRTRFQKIHVVLALLVLVGIFFLVPEFDLENDYTLAILLGIISAFFYALRNIVLKKQVNQYNGVALMWYQLVIVSIALSPLFFVYKPQHLLDQLPALVFLALLTTAIGHTLFLMSFKYFSVTTASIMGGAQPIYGILIGMFFLGEIPEISTIIGGVLILTAVSIESIRVFK